MKVLYFAVYVSGKLDNYIDKSKNVSKFYRLIFTRHFPIHIETKQSEKFRIKIIFIR
jgi:hypothetical protein